MKTAMKSQLKNVPKDQQEKIMELIDKNPDFFKQLDTRVSKAIVNLLPFIPEPKFSIMRLGDFS